MARQKKDGHKINYYISRNIYETLKQYSEDKGQTMTMAIERLITKALASEGYYIDKETKHVKSTPISS